MLHVSIGLVDNG